MNVLRMACLALVVLAFAAVSRAEDAAATIPAPPSWRDFTSMDTVAPAMFVLANIAESKTSWHVQGVGPITGHQYDFTVTPQQRLAFTAGLIGGGLALSHVYPKSRKVVQAILFVGAGYYAGKAYANTRYANVQ